MKKIDCADLEYENDEQECEDLPGVASVDWKADTEKVLEAVDEQLAEHGLEVEFINTDGDYYAWRIVRRSA